MENKNLLKKLGFLPKENVVGIFEKKYQEHNNYAIEINFNKEIINYGKLIISENKTTQNFSQAENWVVLECIDRLLTKGYKPQNIVLEKTWPSGHGTSGRLDICVNREDGTEYLLIECKTFGKEFDKELNNMNRNGGQLFTYFKFSNKADIIMLYTSELRNNEIVFKNEIVKIEDEYRTGDVKDFYEKWNKLTKDNGVFENWVTPYNFESKALIKSQLKPITQKDSSFIFNRFLEILRHNVVSDKGNAFNKIFTLFLCKVYDETSARDDDELKFQWLEGQDDDISFQLRLTDLYKNGMLQFLSRTVSDFDEEKFENEYKDLSEETKKQILKEIHKLRLEKNNEFAIKEVYDHQSFLENAKIVKEVVELLQGYRIRYNKRQQYLSDFFELLLTTGLKQESGQFFTPVPIAQFIIKSLPLDKMVNEKLSQKDGDLLPYMIDYAAGSGHFITEYMHEVQNIINNKDTKKYIDGTAKKIKNWQEDHFDWATKYVYGIEKDYRLVKVGKVGCYLHGDGLANVILSDGLGSFTKTKDYKGKLAKKEDDGSKDNQQFDLILSNPPYSVESFRQTTRDYYTEEDFELYQKLTENSSEIECLFIERTKQLLKDGGIAGIILPSSILNNAGIYSKAREMILEYFNIIAITELGSNTFMATGTNTVVLFLKRRNNFDCINIKKSVEKFFITLKDITINSIENPVEKYINHSWENITFKDYVSLLKNEPNENIQKHDLYNEYQKKIKSKNNKEFFNALIEIEKEKIYYFVLTYNQKTVLVKTGSKDTEKQFLGYEFSNRRGSEGIHPIQRNKTIDECTSLFDAEIFNNPKKASTYIYQAFNNDFKTPIDETLSNNITRVDLVDLLTFDRVEFEKSITLNSKKKIKIESQYSTKEIELITDLIVDKGKSITKSQTKEGHIPVVAGGITPAYYHSKANRNANVITISASGANAGFINFYKTPIWASDCSTIFSNNEKNIKIRYVYEVLKSIQDNIYNLQKGNGQPHVYAKDINKIKIPMPPIKTQENIVAEIEKIEEQKVSSKSKINACKGEIQKIINDCFKQCKSTTLSNICHSVEYGTSSKSEKTGEVPVIRMGNIQDGKINWNDLVYTSNKEEIKKYLLRKNDVLFNRTNSPELVGKVGIYKGERPAIFAGYLIRINYKPDIINPCFLTYILNSETIRNFGFSVMSKSVNQANINGTLLKSYKIPLPSLEKQNEIVAEIEKIELQINDAQKIIENTDKIKKEILQKYL